MSDGTKVLDPSKTRNAGFSDTIATDEITDSESVVILGQKVQRIKLGVGDDGEYADVTTDNPLPITDHERVLDLNKSDTNELLDCILFELRRLNTYAEHIWGEQLEPEDANGD